MTLQEIQYKAQSIINKWRDDDSAPYVEFVEELAHMIVPEPSEDLEEASSKFATHTASNGVSIEFLEEKLSFQEGAKWDREQMMKEAVQMYRCYDEEHNLVGFSVDYDTPGAYGNLVSIIVKEDSYD